MFYKTHAPHAHKTHRPLRRESGLLTFHRDSEIAKGARPPPLTGPKVPETPGSSYQAKHTVCTPPTPHTASTSGAGVLLPLAGDVRGLG